MAGLPNISLEPTGRAAFSSIVPCPRIYARLRWPLPIAAERLSSRPLGSSGAQLAEGGILWNRLTRRSMSSSPR
jgi:hypothetical protein